MTVDAARLRTAATAVESYNAVQNWIDQYGTPELDVTVSWHSASSCTGYKETSHAVQDVVRTDIAKILRRALENTELAARRACTEAGIEFDQ